MHPVFELQSAARYALLDGAVSGLMRAAVADGFDRIKIEALVDDGQTVLELTYFKQGVAVSGHDL